MVYACRKGLILSAFTRQRDHFWFLVRRKEVDIKGNTQGLALFLLNRLPASPGLFLFF